MGICPNCNNNIKLDHKHIENVKTYGKDVLSKTKCCGKPIIIRSVKGFKTEVYKGKALQDNFGNKFDK